MENQIKVVFAEDCNSFSLACQKALEDKGGSVTMVEKNGQSVIDYLKENRAAYVISDPADLEPGLLRILSDEALRQEIVSNARTLAEKNHHPRTNPANVRRWLEEVCEAWEKQG